MTISSRPAKRVAIISLIISVVFAAVCLLIGRWSGFFVLYGAGALFAGATVIWLVLAIQFHQRALAEQEKLDMTALARDKKTATMFGAEGERAKLFAVAQRRLEIFEKWVLPIFAVVIALYQAAAAVSLYLVKTGLELDVSHAQQPLLCAVVMTAVAFVSFLLSRYATGMSAQTQWKPLRAGGSFLFGSAILCFAAAIALALVQFKIHVVASVIENLIPAMLIMLGAETALNIVFDVYRPRLLGQYSRAAFDSRLLGILNEPGEILHTAAGAIDYQFGFKVSETWFYKLLEKAILPLILFGIVTLYLLSCIVVLSPNEEAIIEHLGNPISNDGKPHLVGPGLAFKWPWPFDTVRKYPTRKICELYIGYIPKTDPKTGRIIREPLLWGKQHYEKEYDVLVASRQSGSAEQGAAPVGILKANVPVQYRVKDLYAFLYGHSDYEEPSHKVRPGAEKHLEEICYRELARFAAGATVEVDDESAVETSLLGAGRTQAKAVLTAGIQKAADDAGLGVDVVFVGLQGVHPPVNVAKDYEAVVGAVQKKRALILYAQALRNMTLSAVSGSVEQARDLYALAAEYQQVRQRNEPARTAAIVSRLDKAFADAGGDIFAALRQAQSYAFEKAILARATGERFASQVKADKASERIYRQQQRLTALEEALRDIRKYVIIADSNDAQVYIVDLKEKLTPDLYELGGFEESSSQ